MTNIKGVVINGYKCFYANENKGLYEFSKETKSGYLHIKCTEEQLTNGDIEFMTQHDLTYAHQTIK